MLICAATATWATQCGTTTTRRFGAPSPIVCTTASLGRQMPGQWHSIICCSTTLRHSIVLSLREGAGSWALMIKAVIQYVPFFTIQVSDVAADPEGSTRRERREAVRRRPSPRQARGAARALRLARGSSPASTPSPSRWAHRAGDKTMGSARRGRSDASAYPSQRRAERAVQAALRSSP